VRAVLGADAAVIDHVVQALVAVRRGLDGADDLAGRGLALLAWERLEVDARVLRRALEVAIDAQPLHLAAPLDLLLADDRDVVLGVAGDDARVAPRARGEIDRHAPGVALVLAAGIQRQVVLAVLVLALGVVLAEMRRAHDVATLHGVMTLRRRELVPVA